MTNEIPEDWKKWILTNLSRGVDIATISTILCDHGFDEENVTLEIQRNLELIVGGVETDVIVPNSQKVKTSSGDIYIIDNFLNETECNDLINIIRSNLRPSLLALSETPDPSIRNSSTCDLGTLGNPLVEEIDRRICRMIGIPESSAESLQGQFYQEGQEFKRHTDYFSEEALGKIANELGQRTFTFLIYLNTLNESGETYFDSCDLLIKPEMGKAVLWNNLKRDLSPNPNMVHCGLPVKGGFKAILTKWFRLRNNSFCISKEMNERIPTFTSLGFQKTKISSETLKKLIQTLDKGGNKIPEKENSYLYCTDKKNSPSELVEVPAVLKHDISQELKLMIEEWVGFQVEVSFTYGIRVYRRNALLKLHRDRLETHKLGAILNIAQEVDEAWPLVIEDNYYRRHEVFLSPGEVVLFESARLLHGRPSPLKGTFFANLFCHFVPLHDNKSS